MDDLFSSIEQKDSLLNNFTQQMKSYEEQIVLLNKLKDSKEKELVVEVFIISLIKMLRYFKYF